MKLLVNGTQIELDKEGFLCDLKQWNNATAEALAKNENIILTDQHWEILNLLREFHQQFELSPAMRPLIKYIGQQLEKNKASSIYLLTLFPGSPAKIAAKLAGLPKPDNCL